MQTIRGRLTAWYSAPLALTLAAFAAVLYLDRRSASYHDLDQRIGSEASLTAGILAESYRARGVLVRPDSAGRPVLIPDVAALLEAVPDILIVTARDGSLLFASSDARALTFQQVEQLRRVATAPGSGRSSGSFYIEPDGPAIHYAVRYLSDAGPQFGAILAGANVRSAELGPDQLLATFALVLPLGVAVALLMGSWISRRALGPVDQIITEVREITDGRSLHRRLAEPLAEEAGVQMEVSTPAEAMVVSVDATRIRQLILNLLTNAVKYTPAGGSVRLQLGPANGRLTLSVADTGIGIAPGDLPHIFDRFWRAGSARPRTGERAGAGLGVAPRQMIPQGDAAG